MKFKVGDRVEVKSEFDFYEEYRGKQFVIEECDSSDDTYLCHPTTGGYRIWFSEEKLEPAAIRSVLFPNVEYVLNEKQAKEYADNIMATSESISHITGISYEDSINKLKTWLGTLSNNGISAKNGGKNSMKFTFYVTEGTRPDKNPDGDGKGVIPTMTTFVSIGRYYSGKATCDKADYNERQGCLEAIANAVLGGNFDREYEKFLADKKRKYNESCKCKICGRNYYEDEKTGKRTPFTPEDARKHEEWHEQNKKNKRERYLLRKRAKEIAFEEQAQKMAKEMIKEDK